MVLKRLAEMKIETEHFYLSIDKHGFTIALFNKKIDVDLHFSILIWEEV